MGAKKSNNVKQADWTIMLYIAADGNLANFAVESLKQLSQTAGQMAGGKIVAAAQFAIDSPGGQSIPRYIFTARGDGGIRNSLVGHLNAPSRMTEQEALSKFLRWVYTREECKAKNYALVLWGHGPELFLHPPSAQQQQDHPHGDLQNGSHRSYLTPVELAQALHVGIGENDPLKIIGMDACSMSMFEVAYQIRGLAEFMVASQEEVPDPGLPYDTLLKRFRKRGGDTASLCAETVDTYVRTYEDYICDSITRMKPVTFSALRLAKYQGLADSLKGLTSALWNAQQEGGLPHLLMEARQSTKDFAGGLYVDIFEFSYELRSRIPGSCLQEGLAKAIMDACQAVMDALKQDSNNGLILANSSADSRCHGLSLYFPYLTDDQRTEIGQPMVKGGTDTIGKGFDVMINEAAPGLLLCIRRQLILDTESYYENLELSKDTGWYRFIAEQWSPILMTLGPEGVDLRYSAQQAALNLNRRR